MAGPEERVVPMLRETRAGNDALHEAAAERLALVGRHQRRIKDARVCFRQALTGDDLMGRPITSEFEGRFASLQRGASAIGNPGRLVREMEAGR